MERQLREHASTLITGPLGIGKTHLLGWMADRAVNLGWQVVQVHATWGLRTVPFGALTDITTTGNTVSTPGDLYLDLMAYLRTAADEREGLVVCVDDLPRLDEQSAGFLHQAVVTGLAVVVATARSGETLPDSAAELIAAHHLSILDLEALNEPQTFRLLTALTGAAPPQDLLSQVWQVTAGNPLFITELVTDALERADPGERLRIETRPMNSSVADVVRARLGRLNDDDKWLIQQLAVRGDSSLSGLDVKEPATLERLVQRGLLVTEQDGARSVVRLAHPLFGEALAEELSAVRRSQILRDHANRLLAHGLRRRDDPLAAALALDAAGMSVSPELAVAAAQRAHTCGAPDVAARFATVAFDAAPCAASGVLMAWTLIHLGRPADAYELCEPLYDRISSEEERAMLASTQAICAMHSLSDLDLADAVIARHLPQVHGPWRHELAGTAAGVSMYRGDFAEAQRHMDSVLGSDDAPPRAVFTTMIGGQYALYLGGRATEAARRSAQLADDPQANDGSVPTMRVQLELGLAEALAWHGDPAASWSILDRLRDQVPAATTPSSPAVIVSIVRGLVEVLDGVLDADVAMLEALGWSDVSVYGPWFAHLYARAAYTAARCGRLDDARRLAGKAVAPRPTFGLHTLALARTQAEIDVQIEARDRGVSAYQSVVQRAHALGNTAEELQAALRLVALRSDDEAIRAAASVADRFDGLLGAAVAAALSALAEGHRAAAAEGIRAVSRCGHRLLAADLESAARQLFGGAWPKTLAPLPAADTTGRTTAPERRRSMLTDREMAIATRIATGATDADIANELGISLRTVHAHARSLYSKLTVNSRLDVAAALRHLGVAPANSEGDGTGAAPVRRSEPTG